MGSKNRPPGPEQAPAVQRIRIRYARREPVRYLSHLDTMRMFERVCRRAELPLAYSAGFTPHARISIAAPLGVSILSEGELLDLQFDKRLPVDQIETQLAAQLPPGFELLSVDEIDLRAPAIQRMTTAATYDIEIDDQAALEGLAERVADLMQAESFPFSRIRHNERHQFDLRMVVEHVELDGSVIRARLRQDNEAGGRPDDLVAALEVPAEAARITRTELHLADEPVLPGRPVPKTVEKLPRPRAGDIRIPLTMPEA